MSMLNNFENYGFILPYEYLNTSEKLANDLKENKRYRHLPTQYLFERNLISKHIELLKPFTSEIYILPHQFGIHILGFRTIIWDEWVGNMSVDVRVFKWCNNCAKVEFADFVHRMQSFEDREHFVLKLREFNYNQCLPGGTVCEHL